MYNYLEHYVESLIKNQNEGVNSDQQYLYKKEDYYKVLKPVIEIIKTYKDCSIEEMRGILYEQSGIEGLFKSFIYEKEMAPGIVCTYGTKNHRETLVVGNRQEVSLDNNGRLVPSVEEMTEDTIFDLASITKIFTSLSVLKLVEKGLIDLNEEIIKYAPQFINLKGVTIFDLLSFGMPLKTEGRIDEANSIEEAEHRLFTMKINNTPITNVYTDLGAMALKYVIESVTQESYYKFVSDNILKDLNMKDTHVIVPEMKLCRTVNNNYDGKIMKDGTYSMNTGVEKGIVYDPKAQVLEQSKGNLSGHAGLFSTAGDMISLAKGLINKSVISKELLDQMVINRTGKKIEVDGVEKYIQYFGFLCYSKHPQLENSELFHAMSGKSFASAGWTGNHLTVDPLNELYIFLAGNRAHNRITSAPSDLNDKFITNEFGKKSIILQDGTEKVDSRRFAWDRDALIHSGLKLSIQYKMLEDIYSITKSTETKVTRTIK